ncbi:hypothetical protein LTR70_008829 [Exophiala xenobiotica]|uniref:Transcription initiation factor IIF subunit beta n=1 Tax=Lithohypha guttulata TaxID=1690604 RepID=A0ABR0K0J9_9EURO|nr:hypothetical protein LTR24_008511 [Lithohypha guttulata]KAK5311356.1 hypothetical protein LTR70_008829 [Exophiala xenobiotica]
MSVPIPSVKLEGDDMNVKMEDVSSPSAVSDTYMDDADDDPELNFDEVNRLLWTSKLPKYLWEVLAKASDDDEIDLGTIRVEGSFDNPDRISLMLNDAPIFTDLEKEYVLRKPVLQQKKRRPGEVLMFSEKNKPGYKQRANVWDQLDEDGNMGQGRSQLYEQALRDEKRKENKGKFTPYARNKPIPKITALAGTVHHESETVPVENAEHQRLESERTKALLSEKKKDEIQIRDQTDVKTQYASVITRDERSRITQQANIRKQAAKDNRTARADKQAVLNDIFQAFTLHRFWGLRDLRIRLNQPEQWVKENLEEVATMHRHGDFNGKWELREQYKDLDQKYMAAEGEAPKEEDSDIDMKSEGDDDFEDVGV